MPLLLVFAFIVVPLLELWVIGQVGGVLGLGWTLVLLLVDSTVGAVLVRREGSRAWQAFREAMGAGRVPDDEIVQGALLLFGGALLLTPGFVTDVVGLALVLPVTRAPVARLVRLRFVPLPVQGGIGVWNAGRRPGDAGGSARVDPPGGATPSGRQADGSAPPEPSIEVVSVEREDQIDDGGDDPATHDR